jgi:integrase
MLTEAQVKGIQADDKVRYIADGRTGLRLRVYPTGAKKWVLRTEVEGRTRERVIGEWPQVPVAEARRRAGIAPKAVAAPLTFEEAARRWHAERIVPRYRSSAPIVWRYFERDCEALFPRRLDTITRKHVAALVESKKADGHNSAGKLLRLLRKMFRWAAAHELVETNPMDALDAGDLEIQKAEPRDRLATDDELRTVWNLPSPHGPMLRFALLTACRVGEARAAVADQVIDGIWTHGPTKNGKMHSVPLTRTAAALLAKGWEVRSPEALYQVLDRYVPGLKPHDLRRSAATRMRQLGVSSDVIDAILNHTPPKLQRTYQLPDMKPAMLEALTLWERDLLRIVRPRKSAR